MAGERADAGVDQPMSGQRRRAPEVFAAFVALFKYDRISQLAQ